jgi:gas vesicle protein
MGTNTEHHAWAADRGLKKLRRRKEIMNEIQTNRYPGQNVAGVLVGMLVGGLAGAVTMLLLAPQSGKETRKQIQEKSIELRDRTNEVMEDTMTRIRVGANKLSVSGRDAIKELTQQGQKIAVDQLDRVSGAVEATKTAVKNA